MTTSHDVAKLAKVSQATVSRAFRQDVYIRPETREKVFKAAKELGYFPNYSARSLKNQKSGIIGLMLADADNVFYSALTKSIEKFVNARGYRLLLTYNNEDPEKERKCLETLISSRVEGIFCIPVSSTNRDLIDILKSSGVRIIQVVRKLYDDLNTVTVNDEMGAYIATKYLLERGHRNILFAEYHISEDEAPVKVFGYRRAMEEFGIPNEKMMITDLPFGIDTTGLIAGAIMSNGATAMITSSLPITIAALKACKMRSIRIPADISIIAYDDSEWLELMDISAITHPMEEIGFNMSELMIRSLEEGDEEESEIKYAEVKPYLLLRDSIKNIKD